MAVSVEALMDEPVLVPEPKRKRRRYRTYPRPECTDAQWQAILDLQQNRCAICGEETALYQDHSYRTGKMRGGLCRQCNCALGMLKDSPTRLRRALAYLQNPPAKALGVGESETEKTS
jgi:Recombination endonuclease VII